MNDIPVKTRLKEWFVDYLLILAYLLLLLAASLGGYRFILGDMPEYTELQAHLVATFTSVIPIVLLFAYLDYFRKGSFGKRAAGLKLTYANRRFSASLVRNIVKFMPWQLGHTGVIHGMYTDFGMTAILITNSANVLAILLLGMALFRKDKRHLGDLLAGTKVEAAP